MSRSQPVSEGLAHNMLRNGRRRRAIKYLRRHHGTATLSELAEQIAIYETGESPPPENLRESVYISLHQTHLPKLDENGFLDYDPDAKTVTLRRRTWRLEKYMDLDFGFGVTWLNYYRGLLIAALVAIIAFETVGRGGVSPPAGLVAVVFLAVAIVSMVVQLWTRRWLISVSLSE
jgi:hypothetical protein